MIEKKDHIMPPETSFKGIIGIAQEDITPPAGIYFRNWGASAFDTAEGIHQPLRLTCMTFQSAVQESPLVLIAADLGWWKNAEDELDFRGKLLEALGIEPSHLMVCLSHTHAGPSLSREDASNEGGEFISPYLQLVLDRAIRAVQMARTAAVPAALTWHYEKCSLATNRDLVDPEKERFIVGFNPAQQADDTLLVGRVTDGEYRTLGTLVNYACHPTTLAWDNRLISPDYIGAMRDLVETETKAPCLFLQGASGDLAPAEQYVGDVKIAESYGRQLGYSVLAALEAMLPPQKQLSFTKVVESGAPLAIWQQLEYEPSTLLSAEKVDVKLPLKPLPMLAVIEQQWRECDDRVLKERLWRKRGVRKAVGDGEYARVGLWVWRLGDALLIGQPNEAYSRFQLELRRHFSPYPVGVINIVNGHMGYLPPAELYDKDMYSVWQTPFASGSLEVLTEETIEVAHKLLSHNPI